MQALYLYVESGRFANYDRARCGGTLDSGRGLIASDSRCTVHSEMFKVTILIGEPCGRAATQWRSRGRVALRKWILRRSNGITRKSISI